MAIELTKADIEPGVMPEEDVVQGSIGYRFQRSEHLKQEARQRSKEVVQPPKPTARVALKVGGATNEGASQEIGMEPVQPFRPQPRPLLGRFFTPRWVLFRQLPWVLFLLVAFRLLPSRWSFERLPVSVQTVAIIIFAVVVLVDTSVTVWNVAIRPTRRRCG
jgi:hypothetical protein